jgi:hypothetical protein
MQIEEWGLSDNMSYLLLQPGHTSILKSNEYLPCDSSCFTKTCLAGIQFYFTFMFAVQMIVLNHSGTVAQRNRV